MTWPPQSPDLNPIELLWDELDRRVRKVCPTSTQHLWNILQQEWNNILTTALEKLIKRMPRFFGLFLMQYVDSLIRRKFNILSTNTSLCYSYVDIIITILLLLCYFVFFHPIYCNSLHFYNFF